METLQRTANRGSVSTGYDVANSVKLEADNSEFFIRTVSSAGSRTTGTISLWLKRTELSTLQYVFEMGNVDNDNGRTFARFQTDDTLRIAGGSTLWLNTNRVFKDTSAWYHIVVAIDTTSGTADNRIRVYVNGVEETSFGTRNNPSQNDVMGTNFGKQTIGFSEVDQTGGFCGYMCEVVIQDGVASAPTEFGEFDSATGIWIPKDASGVTMGTNGSYLKFENAASMGAATAGNALSVQNVNQVDQATDTCTNNFAIGNILTSAGGFLVPTEGATKGVLSTSGPGNNTGGASLFSTIPVSNGKWYFEAQNTNSGDVYLYLGVGDVGGIENWGIDGKTLGSATGPSVGWRGGGAQDGKVYINNSATGSADTWETEVVGVALDLDNNKVYFHKSGTYINSGDPASGTDNGGQYDLPTAVDDQWCIGVSAYNLATWLLNFGGYTTISISSAASDANGYGTFEYAPPSGYYAICTKNLAEYG